MKKWKAVNNPFDSKMTIFSTISLAVTFCVETGLIAWWLTTVLTSKKSRLFSFMVFMGTCLCYTLCAYRILSRTAFVIGLYLTAFFLINLLFSDKFSRKMICLGLCLIGRMLPEIFLIAVFQFLEVNTYIGIQDTYQRFLILFTIYILFFVFLKIAGTVLNTHYKKLQGRDLSIFMPIIVSETFMIICLGAVTATTPRAKMMMALCIIALVLTTISVGYLYNGMKKLVESTKIQERYAHLQSHQTLQSKHYTFLNAQVEQTHKLRHDLQNFTQTIQLLLQQQHYQEAEKVTQHLRSQLQRFSKTYYCANPVVSAILFSKLNYAEEKGIRVSAKMQLGLECPFEEADLISLFSNLLDNALEACLACSGEERFIEIADKCQANCYFVTVRNSKPRIPVSFQKGRPETRKEDPALHGVGTQIIEDIAAHYQGTARFRDEGETFTAIVMLHTA